MSVKEQAKASLDALELEQVSFEILFSKHKASLAQHRLFLLSLLEDHMATQAATSISVPGSGAVQHDSTLSRLSTPHPKNSRLRHEPLRADEDASSDEEDTSDGEVRGHFWSRWLGRCERKILEQDAGVRSLDLAGRSRLQQVLLPVIYHGLFEMCVFALIVINCTIMGLEVDLMLRHALTGEKVDIEYREQNNLPNTSWQQHLKNLRFADNMVLTLFIAELMLRLLAEQRDYLCGKNAFWNILDAAVTAICVWLAVRDYCHTTIEAYDRLRFVRILRVARAIQMIRRFRFLRKLRVMLYSILACVQSLAWAAFLLYLFVCVMALYLEDVALYRVQLHNLNNAHIPWEEWGAVQDNLKENWAGMYNAQLSLLYSVTGGADWGDLAKPFCSINKFHCCVYVAWVIIVIFGLINITVGIFARQAQEFHQYDHQLIVEGALEDVTRMRATLMDLFDRMDHNRNGYLSCREIQEGLNDVQIQAYFAQLNIDIEMNPEEFFRLLDDDGNDRVDRDEFAKTCMRLQGGAKPLELARIIGCLTKLQSQVAALDDRLSRISSGQAS